MKRSCVREACVRKGRLSDEATTSVIPGEVTAKTRNPERQFVLGHGNKQVFLDLGPWIHNL